MGYKAKSNLTDTKQAQNGAISLLLVVILFAALIGGYALINNQKKATDREYAASRAFFIMSNLPILTIVGGQASFLDRPVVEQMLENAINTFTTETEVPGDLFAFSIIPAEPGIPGSFEEPPLYRGTTGGSPPANSECMAEALRLAQSEEFAAQVKNGSAQRHLCCIECPNGGCPKTLSPAKVADGVISSNVPPPPTATPIPPTPTPDPGATATPTPEPGGDCGILCNGLEYGSCAWCSCAIETLCLGAPANCFGYCSPGECQEDYCPMIN